MEKPKLFQKNLEKTQRSQKKPKNPRLDEKTQDLWEKTQGVATLLLADSIKYSVG